MNLFAEDQEGKVLTAERAERGLGYRCRECGGVVHMRSGPHRRPHFFHLQTSNCRSSQKSLQHLHTQIYLQEKLGCELEVRFPEMGRIADAVWEAEKLVFEVQCSPISAKEVQERTSDYRRCGYEVVWVMHDDRFNARKLSAAEVVLQRIPHYFTDIDEVGEGIIYDQPAELRHAIRLRRHEKRMPELAQPVRNLKHHPKGWPLYFRGDATDAWLKQVGSFPGVPRHPPTSPWRTLQRWYLGLLRFLLEGVSG